MRTIFLVFITAIIAFPAGIYAQQDDIYFQPEKKMKPLKDRKMYTPIAERQASPGTSLYFYASPVSQYINADITGKDIYYYIFLQGTEFSDTEETEQIPMNISFVIDRSGSMAGNKLEYAKKAVGYAINLLKEEDYISIVQYDDIIETVIEPVTAGEKEKLQRRIQTIESRGTTNLCGGMEKGLQYVKLGKDYFNSIKSIHRVILLSDGLANTGITDPSAISEIARKFNMEHNITLTTIGVGSDYNEDLMTKISVEGGGNYYFINDPEELPGIFAKEFSDMKTLVAKNAVLEVTFPESRVTFDKVYQYPFTFRDNTIKIRLTDFYAEQQKAILIKFHTNNGVGAEMDFRTKLSYTNTIGGENQISDNRSSVVVCTNSSDLLKEGINADAHMGYTLMMSADYLAKAQEACDNRNFATAKQYVKMGMDVIEEHFVYVIPNPYLEEIYDDLKKYKEDIAELETTRDPVRFRLIQKGSKCRNYNRSYKSCRLL